ncbi:hypothetical protein FNO01nite_19200 [Flavobacterium noncentrifugens]|uniref:YD repeat-containing protein n=1 Tax=Flavobacterium noncentrifugens TaxID=1128970 RepID=A0A1G8YKD0_9FLAO|nr:hypothetical protein [Flavobacterium noncentrifugens]GEP51248.1 hypothetical protein FNO01nite_19200 [Flavobacterium noncentrifugens]SDK02904.1 hypothetical protein SAMN04487935_2358 [Flavobacterium noncentrifugens]
MKYTFIAILLSCLAFGQNAELIFPSQKQFINKKLAFYTLEDANGNSVFTKNDGLNGDITMLFASDYDNQKRSTRNWSAHSNVGYSVGEKVYKDNQVLTFYFVGDTAIVYDFDRKTLQKINSKEDFLKMPGIKNLERGKKIHTSTEILDDRKNVLQTIYLSENGDTTQVNISRYNAQGKEIFFHLGDCGSEDWVWDIYTSFNDHGDETQSVRLQMVNGIRDTTELRTNSYNSKYQLVSTTDYWQKKFSSKTEYFYDQNDLLIRELLYQPDEKKRSAETTYKYDKAGKLLKKIVVDYHYSEKGTKEIFVTKESP